MPRSIRPWLWWIGLALVAIPLLLLKDRPRSDQPRFRAEWLAAGDTRVRALRTGSGDTTVLLVHGYLESLLSFRSLIPDLAQQYRVLALDLPGSGLSQNPAGPYSLPAISSQVEQFMDRYSTGPVILLGHSMGGAIAATLALRRPDRVVALVLIAPAGYGLGFGLEGDSFSSGEQRLAAWSHRARQLLLPVEAPGWLEPPDGLPGAAPSDSASRVAAAGYLRDFDFTALRHRFGDIRQPTLLLWGGLDPLIPVRIGREIAGRIPGVRYREIPNSWHRPQVEQPGVVMEAIVQFLNELETR